MTISAAQIRAGRGLLNWTAKDLSQRIGITPSSLSAIENGQSKGSVQTLAAIEATLMAGGVDLLPSDGVAMRQVNVLEYKGSEGLKVFMNDVYEVARDIGGDICLHNAVPEYWDKWLGEEWHKTHIPRMLEIKERYNLRITCPQNKDMQQTRTYAEYRWIPQSIFNDRAFYCYGPKLAFLNFEENNVHVFVLEQPEFANGFRGMFNIMWDNVAEKIEKLDTK